MTHAERTETTRQIIELEDDMVICSLKPELIIDLDNAKTIVQQRLDFCKGTDFPTMMIINDDYLLFENPAFEYFSSKEGLRNVSALAIVMHSPLRKVLTNFSLLFYRHTVPFRVFTSVDKARIWLFGYIAENMLDDEY